MKKPRVTFVAVMGLISMIASTTAEAAAAAKKPVVVKLSHATDDLHSVFMALKLGKAIASKGHPTTLFANLEGVRLFTKSQPGDLRYGHSDKSFKQLVNAFTAAGGKIVICPHCAAEVGVEKKALAYGAVIASEDQVATLFSEADKVIDY